MANRRWVLEGKEIFFYFQSGTYPDTSSAVSLMSLGASCVVPRADAGKGALSDAIPPPAADPGLIRVADKAALFSEKHMFSATHNPI